MQGEFSRSTYSTCCSVYFYTRNTNCDRNDNYVFFYTFRLNIKVHT
jgi:hypothetical protein